MAEKRKNHQGFPIDMPFAAVFDVMETWAIMAVPLAVRQAERLGLSGMTG